MNDREIVESRLALLGVHPGEADLRDIAAGFPTLSRWYEILGEALDPAAEPATIFPVVDEAPHG